MQINIKNRVIPAFAMALVILLQSVSVYASSPDIAIGTSSSTEIYGISTAQDDAYEKSRTVNAEAPDKLDIIPYGFSAIGYPESMTVTADTHYQSIDIVLTEDNIAKTITVNVPSLKGVFYQSPNAWVPGEPGSDVTLAIQNTSGHSYRVTGLEIAYTTGNFSRPYNQAAQYVYGTATTATKAAVAQLSADEWYELNRNHYTIDETTRYDRVALQNILYKSTNATAGVTETSLEMIDMAQRYHFYGIFMSFDNNIHSVTHLNGSQLYTLPYSITNYADGLLTDIVITEIFSEDIDEDGFLSTMSLATPGSHVNNLNHVSWDFGFTLTLELQPEDPGTPPPGPGPGPTPDPDPNPTPNPKPKPEPEPEPDPDPAPTPTPNPDPSPSPDPGTTDPGSDKNPGSNIPDVYPDRGATETILDEATPLAQQPVILIDDEGIPLATLPKTGSTGFLHIALALCSTAILAGCCVLRLGQEKQ